MKRNLRQCSCLAMALALTFGAANVGLAQVESLNPNPLQPSGVGSGPVGGDYARDRGGEGMGINIGPRASGGNENPADTLLREMYGRGYKNPTGKVRFRGPEVRNARRMDPSISKFTLDDGGAVYFSTRGDYEDQLYRPRRGTYRSAARTRSVRPTATPRSRSN